MACNNMTYTNIVMSDPELRKSLFKYSFMADMLTYNIPTAMMINKAVTPVWVIIGTFGNIISAIVWANPRMRTCNTAAYYLTCLAIADLVFLFIHLAMELQMPWLLGALDLQGWCQIVSVANISVQYFCVFLVSAFTVERFLSVRHPFKSERFGRTRTPKIIAVLLIICILLGVPQAYFWHINFVGECQVRDSARATNSFFSVYAWCTELTIFGLLPLVVLFLNTSVIMKIRTVGNIDLSKLERKSSSRQSRNVHIPFRKGNSSKTAEETEERWTPEKESRCSLNAASRGGGTSSARGNQRGTTITLLWVSFYLIGTTLPNTLVYALQPNFSYGPLPCPLEDMAKDAHWETFFVFNTVKIIIKEISLSHHVGNIFIYMATSRRFLKLVIKSLVNRAQSWDCDSKDTVLQTIRASHVKENGDAV